MPGMLKAGNVRTAIRYGQSLSDLAEKYECSEEDVERNIKRLFKYDGDKILKQLQDSAKRASGVKNRGAFEKASDEVKARVNAAMGFVAATTVGTERADEAETVDIERADEAETVGRATSGEITEVMNAGITEKVNPGIAELKDRKAEIQETLTRLECDYFNALRYHEDQTQALGVAAKKLEELTAQFNAAYDEFQALTEEDGIYTAIMRRSRIDAKEQEIALRAVEQKLRELEITTICLYNNGEIGVFDGPEISFDTSGAAEILGELVKSEICEALRLKDLKNLSEAMAILKNAKASGVRAELIIEDEEVLEVFAGVTSSDENVA